jgi:Sulfotransferase domain
MVGFAEELITSYPDAKVILIEREIESWYTSFDKAIISNIFSPFLNLIANLDSHFMGRIGGPHRRWAQGYMRASNADEMRRHARDMYKAHYELVRRITPKERILEYKMDSGWAPLCEFLGKEVPDTPFPRVNDAQALNEIVIAIVKKGIINIVKKSAVYVMPVVLVSVGWYFTRRAR